MSASRTNPAYVKLSQIYKSLEENKPQKIKSVYLDWGASEKNSSNIYRDLLKLDHENYSNVLQNVLKDGGDIDYQIPSDSLVKLHEPDFLGYTALHFAVITCNLSGLQALLEYPADFTIKNGNEFTALRLAIETSFEKGFKCLNLKGTLRHPAVDLILDAHVATSNPSNPKCRDGVSHFHAACMTNNARAVELFLSHHGVDVNEVVNSDSHVVPGYTPLHFAARYCSLEVMAVLLNNGATRHPKDAKGMTPLHLLIEYAMEILAAKRGSRLASYKWLQTDLSVIESMMKLLTSSVEDSSEVAATIDDTGLTRLHVACMKYSGDKVKDPLGMVLSDDSDYEVDRIARMSSSMIPSDYRRDNDPQPSDMDVNNEDLSAIEVPEEQDDLLSLLDKILETTYQNATINSTSTLWQGYTPLHFAAHFNPSVFVHLCQRGADMSIKDPIRGVTPLDLYLENHGGERLRDILLSYDYTRQLRMSDGTRLVDLVHETLRSRSLSDGSARVQLDSLLWPGCTLLHLAVACLKKQADTRILDLVDHSKLDETKEKVFDENICNCIEDGIDLTVSDASGMTPLHLALRQGKQAALNQMLHHLKARLLNPVDSGNLSHFHSVVCANNSHLVDKFLASGVDANSPVGSPFAWRLNDDREVTIAAGSTPLHMAVATASHEAVILLLSKDAVDPGVKNADGMTPLHLAFLQNSRSLMHTLLSDSRVLRENSVSDSGLSNLHVACHSKNTSAARCYLKLGGVDANGVVPREPADEQLAPYAGYSPLHFAVQSKSAEIVELLVQHGGDIDAKTTQGGLSPLYLALIGSNNSKVKNRLFRLLRNRGQTSVPEIGVTSLHLACMRLDKAEIEASLRSGLDVNGRIHWDSPIFAGHTPLHVVADFDHGDRCGGVDDVAELLLKHGADVTALCNDQTPLHCAYEILNSNLQKMLLKQHGDYGVNPINTEGLSHFHIACTKDDPGVVEEFLKHSSLDIEHTTDHFLDALAGYSPLHFAVSESCEEVIEVLLKRGCDVNARDSNGSTPLHVAVEAPRVKVGNIQAILGCGKADISARNVHGKSVLESLVTSFFTTNIESYYVHLLLAAGAPANVYNPVSTEGLLGVLLCENDQINKFMNVVLQHAGDLTSLDPRTGGNSVHNLVSVRRRRKTESEYACAIETLLAKGCALDLRNFKGETPLHTAMKYENRSAVGGLLMLGVDVNVADLDGTVPFEYCNGESNFAKEMSKDLAWYVHKLKMFDIHVNDKNRAMYDKVKKGLGNSTYQRNEKSCMAEFERVKQAKIKDRSIPVHLIMSERGVADYPTMPLAVRQAIEEFFQRRKTLFQNYVNLGGLLLLQHRKVQERVSLMKDAKEALMLLANRGLPDPCTEAILRNLRNEDLKNVIVVRDEFVTMSSKRRRVDE